VIVSGRVRVHIGKQELAQMDKGGFFGEMSLFDAEKRSASVTTLSVCDCLVLTQQQLYEAIDETPGIALNIIRILSRRIRELNLKIKDQDAELMLFKGQPDSEIELSRSLRVVPNVRHG
jgi:CRP-like cAMP-binding protein